MTLTQRASCWPIRRYIYSPVDHPGLIPVNGKKRNLGEGDFRTTTSYRAHPLGHLAVLVNEK